MNIIMSVSYKDQKKMVVEEFTKIAEREGKGRSELIVNLMEEYVKVHSSGNDTFKLDNWEDAGFQAVPAFLSNDDKWVDHYKNSNEKDKTKLRIQAINLSKKFRMVDINE